MQALFTRPINRRHMLRILGISTGGLVLLSLLPACDVLEIELDDGQSRLRGTPDGRILSSRDGGQNWRIAADFGPAFAVRRLSKGSGQVYARLEFQALALELKSTDGQTWYTREWEAPTL